MEIEIITSKEFKTNNWSGGTTTQLYIYPPTAAYQKQNFNFRLSTAKVETEKSDFTSLPGISRKIMVLNGEITIHHENHYAKRLGKFDADTFEGNWKTSSVGMCIDFNLMTSGNTKGELSAVVIEKDNGMGYKIEGKKDWFFIYVYSGKVSFALNNNSYKLNKGDLLVLTKVTTSTFQIKGIEKSELIFSEITCLENNVTILKNIALI